MYRLLILKKYNTRELQRVLKIVSYYHKSFKIKRQQLKLGLVVFEYKPLMYGNFLLKHDFNLVLSNQSRDKKTQFENTLSTFRWSWDWKSLVTLLTFLILASLLVKNYVTNLYVNVFNIALIHPDHLSTVLNHTFDLIDPTLGNNDFNSLSSTLADLSIYLNLLS
jgi:hypothetical protein